MEALHLITIVSQELEHLLDPIDVSLIHAEPLQVNLCQLVHLSILKDLDDYLCQVLSHICWQFEHVCHIELLNVLALSQGGEIYLARLEIVQADF